MSDDSFMEKLGGHCYNARKGYGGCCVLGLLTFIIILSMYVVSALATPEFPPPRVCMRPAAAAAPPWVIQVG